MKHEADGFRKLAKNLLDALGGVAELRLSIYEFLCVEKDGVHIPDFNHDFFHEHDTADTVNWVAMEEISWPDLPDQDEKKAIVDRRLAAIRERYIFDPKLFGPQMAREVTEAFLEMNVLHFRDARFMNEFINTPFPCGAIPRDHVRNIVIYIRFEDFLERAGWDVRSCPDTPHEPGPDFKWREHGVYSTFRRDIAFIQRLVFAGPPEVTLLMVTPFGRWDAKELDKDRINLNFLEVILPTYNHLKKNGSATKVISKKLDSLIDKGWYSGGAGWVRHDDEDVTWQVEIAANAYSQSTIDNYVYPGGRKSSERIQLEKAIKEAAAQRAA
ncbi:hypothetical protein J4E83_004837 [Alternaria metachromatica]|uniref:uncharacterized protein n=1 Tax=Alternaria metachromatica TaxID=283354 RepID=UPI0020C4DAA1|nr:uncharacterized protein J4E83_004837 [Alternaria metachromatica]KAI4622098.1 hypothetical protein J4E83_004837 [Alternaria metachromatica]